MESFQQRQPSHSKQQPRFPRILSRWGFLIVGALWALVGCGQDSAHQTAQKFIRALDYGDVSEIYGLLSSASKSRISQVAKMATAQTGGLRRFTPSEMLVVGFTQSDDRVVSIANVQEQGTRATVQLALGKKQTVTLHMTREKNGWRIELSLLGKDLPPSGA